MFTAACLIRVEYLIINQLVDYVIQSILKSALSTVKHTQDMNLLDNLPANCVTNCIKNHFGRFTVISGLVIRYKVVLWADIETQV